MNTILKELLNELMFLGEAPTTEKDPVPPDIKKRSEVRGGKYYAKGTGEYLGRVQGNEWIPAAEDPEISGKNVPKVEPNITQRTPSASTTGTETPSNSEVPEPSKYVSSGQSSWSSEQVFGNIFTQSSEEVNRDGVQIKVRKIMAPEDMEILIGNEKTKYPKGASIDANTDAGKKACLQIIKARLDKLDGPVKQAAKRLTMRATKEQQQRLKKFMGNAGELYTLYKVLETGTEAYLLPDSYPKNDIVLFSEDVERGLRVTEISVKSSTGEQAGALGSNARVPLHAAVENKQIEINGNTYDAKDAIDASMTVYSLMLRFLTEGHITGENRELVIKDTDKSKFDMDQAEEAIRLSREGSKGAQDIFLKARKLTPNDVSQFEQSNLFKRIKTNPERKELLDYYLNMLRQETKPDGTYKAINTKSLFTSQISDILDRTGSSIVFESDLVSVKCSEANGFESITITPAEIMRKRAEDTYGEISSMSAQDQLRELGNWRLSTRGLNTHDSKTRKPKFGYFGAIINFAPPTNLLIDKDKLGPQEFIEYVKSKG